MDYTVIQ